MDADTIEGSNPDFFKPSEIFNLSTNPTSFALFIVLSDKYYFKGSE